MQPTTDIHERLSGTVVGAAIGVDRNLHLLPATGNYFEVVQRIPVKIVFESGQDPDHLLRPGMSVEPSVRVR